MVPARPIPAPVSTPPTIVCLGGAWTAFPSFIGTRNQMASGAEPAGFHQVLPVSFDR